MPQRSTRSTTAPLAHIVRFVLFCAFVSGSGGAGYAASLYGKVIEVNSGDVITIFNLNRPVRVKLLGIDAPELSQAFGDVARKHLSDLVFNQAVLVHYSGIAADKSVTGRVLLNDADVGAQMIRDGAAWFDPNNSDRLAETDRDVYQQSEQAARSERRGLWQTENPTAPWEFVKIETLKKNPVAHLNPSLNASGRRSGRSTPELDNLLLMKTAPGAAGPRRLTESEIADTWRSLTRTIKNWHEMRPAGQDFSVFVPDEGRLVAWPSPFGADTVDVNFYLSRDGANLYIVFWFEGPTYGESDKTAIKEAVFDTIKDAHKGYERADRGFFFCKQQREKNVSMNGYTGTEFDMSSCSLPTRARGFTRVVDNTRQMVAGIVFYGDPDENVARFIRSFTVGAQKGKAR